jgi:hypothetical protein
MPRVRRNVDSSIVDPLPAVRPVERIGKRIASGIGGNSQTEELFILADQARTVEGRSGKNQ